MQTVEKVRRKGPGAERLPKQQRLGIISAITVHGESPSVVARRAGVGINTMVAEAMDELLSWGSQQYERGYRAGRGPNPPATPMRPVLVQRRAA